MRFEVSYPAGSPHEVDLPGTVAVLGRDPASDLVLNDTKCSRRHAVVEEEPDGLVIRDAGSANGVFVNGRKVERSRLRPGDTIQLGDVRLKVLPHAAETVVMAPDDLVMPHEGGFELPEPRRDVDRREARPEAPAPSRAPEDRPARTAPAPALRRFRACPPTITLLALLWLLSAVGFAGLGLFAAARIASGSGWGWVAGALGLLASAFAAVLAFGLRTLAPWARHLQIATASLGLLLCPFTLASATVLVYMLRPEVKAAFGRDRTISPGGPTPGSAEATFSLSLIGMVLLGTLLTGAVWLFLRAGRG